MRIRHLVIAAALPALLTACASDDTTAGTDVSQDGGSTPACDEVWQAGNTLPEGYEGCEDAEGQAAAVWRECETGGRFTSYDDALFAMEGGEIVETAGDVADLYSDCEGEERVTQDDSGDPDITSQLRGAAQGEPWADHIVGAEKDGENTLRIYTNLVDPRDDGGSPEAKQAIEICQAGVALMESKGSTDPKAFVYEDDGTTWILHGHPAYPDPCTEV